MGILASLVEQLVGPWLKILLIPALVLGLLTAAHEFVKARAEAKQAHEKALVAQGKQQCLAEVELAETKAKLLQAEANAVQAVNDAKASADLANKANTHVHELESTLSTILSSAGGSDHCLSDGVRTRIWGRTTGSSTGSPPAAGGGGSPAKPAGKAP